MKKKEFNKGQNGQSMIIIAISIVAIIGFVGLTVDVGRLFIAYGNLRKAVDAGALAAAAQFREGRGESDLLSAAKDAMSLNGVNPTTITIEVCDYSLPPAQRDPLLCTEPKKKLVRVNATGSLDMTFLNVVGVHTITLSSSSISEAASMDVVLVIDISESMAWDAPEGSSMRDPHQCNDPSAYPGSEDAGEYAEFPNGFPGECHPFEEVKHSASAFVKRVLDKEPGDEEDRLAIVTFANGWSGDVNMGTHYRTSGWTNDQDTALDIIKNLTIFDPGVCKDSLGNIVTYYGPCRNYDSDGNFLGLYCYSCIDSGDLSALTSTNIGGGLRKGGQMFAYQTREDSLWVVILLTDGMANATDIDVSDDIEDFSTYPLGYCPNDWTFPLCQDENVTTRHAGSLASYDADDYARDMANFVGCYPEGQAAACGSIQGQGAVIFTIGLGNGVLDTSNEVNGQPYGTNLLRYIAAVGYDGDPASDPCTGYYDNEEEWKTWCGNYYFSPEGQQLLSVFENIASRIFTRLSR